MNFRNLRNKMAAGVFAVALTVTTGQVMAKDSSKPIVIPTDRKSVV
jgi:hypothetical protein